MAHCAKKVRVPMSTQRIVWTALPNGFDEGYRHLQLSVFVSPRLTPGPLDANTLASFPDFQSWPSTPVSFTVEFDTPGGPRSFTAEPDPNSPTPDPSLWGGLFPLTTPVKGFGYKPLDGLPIRSYHALGLHDHLKTIYQTAATAHATDYPPVSVLGELMGHLFYDPKRDAQLRQTVLNEPFPPADEPFSPHKDFMRFQVFHAPFSKNQVPIQLPEMEFHDIAGALARYPGLLRQLGLVCDLRIPRGDVSLPLTGTVRVIPSWQPQTATEDARPATHYTFGQGRAFQVAPRIILGRPPGYVDGKLPLGDTQRYGVIQLDVDGLSFKSLHLAGNLPKLAQTPFAQPLANYWQNQNKQQPTENTASLPSGTSAGLTVVKNYRAAGIYDLLSANTAHNGSVEGGTGDSMDLWLEDVVRGHRLDVLDGSTSQWASLHQRHGTYKVDDAPVDVARPDDEGWAMTALTSPVDPAAPKELRLHEAIAEWSGWALSAPRPESVIGTHDETASGPEKPATSNFRLQATFTPVPGTLPRLRFGRRYRLKARAVDLAGNGPALNEPGLDPSVVSPPIIYRRYEPVAQPVLIPRDKYKDSESVEHLVVRTWTTPPSGTPTTEITERHVAPPVTTVQMAERHGKLDDPAGPGGFRADAYTLLTGLEGTAPSDPVPDKQWMLNYLADPMARGAAFTGLPGTGTTFTVPFDANPWPKYQPFRIKVVDGTGAPGMDSSGALLVQLPPAEVARVRMSCYPDQGELEGQSGIWRWVMEKFSPGDPETPATGNPSYDQLVKQAVAGQHWMVTPYREILLIHAVQQPLVPPHFNTMGVSRAPGATWADVRYATPMDGKSTQKFDVHGKWTQWIDALAKDGPEQVDGEAHAFTAPVDPIIHFLEGLGRHEFGDTKHRYVHYDGTAMTRFPEFFPAGTAPLTRVTSETDGEYDIHIPSSARPAVPDVLYILPAFEWVTGQSGSTSLMTRKGNTLRIYLNRPWYSSGDDEQLGVVLSVRPPVGSLWTADYAREVRGKYGSQWGVDPAVVSADTGSLQPSNFDFRVDEADNLTLDEVGDAVCTVAAHDVKYDAEQKLWYCDVRISPNDGSTAYMPFVRLALTRYQPYSILNAHLSRVARADFAQLPADRTVSVAPGPRPGFYNVALYGLHGHIAADGPWRRVEVQVEHQDPSGADFGWTPVGQPVPLMALTIPNLYSGTVQIPEGRDPAQYRLAFKEYEKLLADPDDRSTSGTPKGVWRLIFAHAMPFGPQM
jgi:hypothetical protein